jgi:hypothetical protein
MRARAFVAAVLVLGCGRSAAAGVVVGVLEEPQCADHAVPAVRPLFLKIADGWTALSAREVADRVPLRGTSWTVALDGRSLGSITTVDRGFKSDYPWTFARDRMLALAPGVRPPNAKNRDARFAGWCNAPKRRPLVVVSSPNFTDAAEWKPFKAAPELRDQLLDAFKAQAGAAATCIPGAGRMTADYEARDLLISAAYADRSGRRLVSVGLDPARNSCDEPDGPAWSTHLFLLDEGIRHLGAGLTLVDAGDYDADGKSELLFWYSGYNEDGYTLFDDAFRRGTEFRWKYH